MAASKSEVADTGGVPREHIIVFSTVFIHQSNGRGTGLGLSVSYV